MSTYHVRDESVSYIAAVNHFRVLRRLVFLGAVVATLVVLAGDVRADGPSAVGREYKLVFDSCSGSPYCRPVGSKGAFRVKQLDGLATNPSGQALQLVQWVG